MSDAGRLDEKLLALLDEALERIGPERTARRAALLSAKSAEMYWVDNDVTRVRRGWSTRRSRSRVRSTRPASSGRRAAAQDLHPGRAGRPARCGSRLADEMVELGEAPATARRWCAGTPTGSGRSSSSATCRRSIASSPLYARLADELRMPEHSWHTLRAARDARPARRRHRGGRAPRRRRRGGPASEPSSRSREQYYGIQMIQIRSMQGRAGELLPAVRELAERFPGIPGLARRRRSRSPRRSGDVELARRELDRFAGDDFSALPRDVNWFAAMSLLGRGDRADRRHRRTPSAPTSCSSPTRGW